MVTRAVKRLQLDIGDRMIAGASFSDIEELINEQDLDPEIKAALWLYALSYVPPARQRHQALEHLVDLAG